MVPDTGKFVLWQRDADNIGDMIDVKPDTDCLDDDSCAFDDWPGGNRYDPSSQWGAQCDLDPTRPECGPSSEQSDGTTYGEIVARNGNRIAVVDIPPGLYPGDDGVKILSRGDGPNDEVTFRACGPPFDAPITLYGQGGVMVKCGSLRLAVGAGEAVMEIPWNPVVVPQGAAILVEEAGPGELSITSDPRSTAVVTVGGVEIHPGESIIVDTTNAPPVTAIDGPASGSVVAAGTPISFTGSFTDANVEDTHTATWDFDGVTVPGTVSESGGVGTVTVDYAFLTPGIYHATLTVTDDSGGSDTADTVGDLSAFVVVYDPEGGFVTGGGWINSPPGAYARDLTLTGKATFGFVSKYQKG
ncbi:MAG TPA: PKD domain-containing protein, partial [Thermoplasmata archaeon]|nr:PKD domain-containing protein [Thermoplasmata archaeon]